MAKKPKESPIFLSYKPELLKEGEGISPLGQIILTPKEVEDIISSIEPESTINEEHLPVYYEVINKLKSDILGQDMQMEQIAEQVEVAIATRKLREGGTLCNIFLSGPTGTGKTQSAKTLAHLIFGDSSSYIYIPCNELSQPHSESKIFGTTDGYVGFGKETYFHSIGKDFKEALKNNSLNENFKDLENITILLFDEIDKAHPKVIQALIGILGEGKIKLSTKQDGNQDKYIDEVVDLNNTIIIFTSNLGEHEKSKKENYSLGFTNNKIDENEDDSSFNKVFKDFFSPEFRGRIDKTIHFNKLSKDTARLIIQKNLNKFNIQLLAMYPNYSIHSYITPEAIEEIVKNGYSKETGARGISDQFNKTLTYIQKAIILNEEKLKQHSHNPSIIKVDFKNNKYISEIYFPEPSVHYQVPQSVPKTNTTSLQNDHDKIFLPSNVNRIVKDLVTEIVVEEIVKENKHIKDLVKDKLNDLNTVISEIEDNYLLISNKQIFRFDPYINGEKSVDFGNKYSQKDISKLIKSKSRNIDTSYNGMDKKTIFLKFCMDIIDMVKNIMQVDKLSQEQKMYIIKNCALHINFKK